MEKVFVVSPHAVPKIEALVVQKLCAMQKKRTQIIFEKANFKNRGKNVVTKYLRKRRGQFIYIAGATYEQYYEATKWGLTFGTFNYDSKGILVRVAHVMFHHTVSSAADNDLKTKYSVRYWEIGDLLAPSVPDYLYLVHVPWRWPQTVLN